MYGFAKSDQSNIDAAEEAQFRKAAVHVLGLTDEQLSALILKGQFSELEPDSYERDEKISE
ncbi:type II toxin-antitoxin system RelE/ParE family toxin [Zoogloea sp.]|uniref:type II toxin-antitoxin system RelE/ParE family toxin n=1 Tax=Zoogloea sp. TaxID=49181 RepID=UPI0035AD8D40